MSIMGFTDRFKKNADEDHPADSLVKHLSDEELDALIPATPVPVVVDFWAPWCTPCHMLAPTIEKLAKEYDGKAVFAKVNVDDNQVWAGKLGVRGIPTVAFFSGGKVVNQFVGVRPDAEFRKALDAVIHPPSA
jgi:thioredoxin 1